MQLTDRGKRQLFRIGSVVINASSREAARAGVDQLRRLNSEIRRTGGAR
jgi:hypothetical protein